MLSALNPLHRYLMIAKLVALLGTIAVICWQSHEIHKWHVHSDDLAAARLADQAKYTQAQKDAAAQNKAQVQQVEQQQQKVTDNVEAQYGADLARLERLHDNAQTAQRPPVKSSASSSGQAASGPCNQTVPLSGSELLQAQQTELQLNALIDWVMQQQAIDPNAKP